MLKSRVNKLRVNNFFTVQEPFLFYEYPFIVVIVNVLVQLLNESVNYFKFFPLKHFHLQPSEKASHCSIIYTVAFFNIFYVMLFGIFCIGITNLDPNGMTVLPF